MAGQQTMSGLIMGLTGQTLVSPVILTRQFWIWTYIFHIVVAYCVLVYNAVVISFIFGLFFLDALH